MNNKELATLFLNLATIALQEASPSSAPIQNAAPATTNAPAQAPSTPPAATGQVLPPVQTPAPAESPVQTLQPPAQPSPIPNTLQSLIQEMNRQGATFDMPPQTSIYDRLSDHLASLYASSSPNQPANQ